MLHGEKTRINISSKLFAAPHKHQGNIKSQGRQSLEYDDQVILGVKASTDQASIPFQPLCFVFKKINYFVDMPKVNSLPCMSFLC